MELFGIILLILAFSIVIYLWESDNKLREDAMEAIGKPRGSAGEAEQRRPSLDPDIAFLREYVNPLPRFQMSEEVLDLLLDDDRNPHAISLLVGELIRHLRMVVLAVHITILPEDAAASKSILGPDGVSRDIGGKRTTSTAGRYIPKSSFTFEIEIHIKKKYLLDHVVAIVCHEVVHHYLREKNIKRLDTAANERLTDVAAVYLGLGYHLLRGYRPSKTESKRMNAKGETITRTTLHSLGYINCEEIEGLVCETEKLLRETESEKRQAEDLRASQESRHRDAEKMLETAETLLRFNDDLLARMMDMKTPLDVDTLRKVQANVIRKERGEFRTAVEKATAILNGPSFERDEDALAGLNSLCKELAAYNTAFQAGINKKGQEEATTC